MESKKEMIKAGQGSNDLDDTSVSSLAHAIKSLDHKMNPSSPKTHSSDSKKLSQV
jgi:hypothetical protein